MELFLVQIVGMGRANFHIMDYDLKFKFMPGYGQILCAPEQNSPNLDYTALTHSMMVWASKSGHILKANKILNDIEPFMAIYYA